MAKRKALLDELLEKVTSNPVTNEVYQQELARLEVANQILEARRKAHLSQSELAERIGTKQAGVARMERAGSTSFNLRTLAKIAQATGLRLVVRFEAPAHRVRYAK